MEPKTFAIGSFVLFACVAGLLTGCPGELQNPERFACDVQQSLLPKRCATKTCHGGEEPASGLDLETPGVATRLSIQMATETCTGPLVVPGHPEESVLYRKVATDDCGPRMPFAGRELNSTELACVWEWIEGLGAGGAGGPPPVVPSAKK